MSRPTYSRRHEVKSFDDLISAKEKIEEALKENRLVVLEIRESEKGSDEIFVKVLSEIVDNMELYYSKKCNEFEKKHIINYVNKMHGSYVSAKYIKKLFELRGLKY